MSRAVEGLLQRERAGREARPWIDSEGRARLLQQAEAPVEGNVSVQRLTGLEAWFSIPEKPAMSPPPRHKMAIVLVIGLQHHRQQLDHHGASPATFVTFFASPPRAPSFSRPSPRR
jgi:hypothetical protein